MSICYRNWVNKMARILMSRLLIFGKCSECESSVFLAIIMSERRRNSCEIIYLHQYHIFVRYCRWVFVFVFMTAPGSESIAQCAEISLNLTKLGWIAKLLVEHQFRSDDFSMNFNFIILKGDSRWQPDDLVLAEIKFRAHDFSAAGLSRKTRKDSA